MREIDKEYAFEDGYNAAANELKGGDTISREALKKAIEQYQIQWDKNCETDIAHWDSCEHILALIDNAPTAEIPVNLTEAEKIVCKAYLEDLDKIHSCNEYYLLMRLIDNAPTVSPKQGEWIKEPNGKTTDIYRCSICGRSILLCKDADLSKYPFCHCGAKMGGAE